MIALASCATTGAGPAYTYTEDGISLTSEPNDAKVEIELKAVPWGRGSEVVWEGKPSLTYLTPYYNPKDHFARYCILAQGGRETKTRFMYHFKVSRPGYKSIEQDVDGLELKPAMHWRLLPADRNEVEASLPVALLGIDQVVLNNNEMKPGIVRYEEVKLALNTFLGNLIESSVFSDVTTDPEFPLPPKYVKLTATFKDRHESHSGRDFAKGFMTGFFTLGLAKVHSVKVDFYSTATLKAVRWDGAERNYSADSHVEIAFDPNNEVDAEKSLATGRRHATDENLAVLLDKLRADATFLRLFEP